MALSSASTAALSASGVAAATSSAKTQKGSDHPEELWYGLIAVLVLATAANAVYMTWATYRRHRGRRNIDSLDSRPSNASGRLSLRRLPHAVLSALRIVSFRVKIPLMDLNVLELVYTIVYMGGCLVWCFTAVDGWHYPNNLTPKTWADRTGKLATIQFPLIVLLSTRNNVITWLTGIGHEKLNILHRVVARCMMLIIWLHVVGMYYRSPAKLLNAGYKHAGLVAAIAITLLVFASVKPIRQRFYEIFYASHMVFVFCILIGVQMHVDRQGYSAYIWPAWAIWAFDRAIRLARYVLFNLVLAPAPGAAAAARVTAVGADGVRVALRRRIPGGWHAGQHVFLAFPTLGVQSHPFTISSLYACGTGDKSGAEMVFTLRARGGLTRTLLERALAADGGVCEIPAMVDGPYGHPQDIRPFETCVFIAGGTGVTYTMARMHQLLRDVGTGDACARRVVFVWAVRTDTEYEWVADELAQIVAAAPGAPGLSLAVDVYLTGPGPGPSRSASQVPTLEGADLDLDLDIDLEKAAPESLPSSAPLSKVNSASGCDAEKRSPTATVADADADMDMDLDMDTKKGRVGIRRRPGRPDVCKILEEEVLASYGAVSVDVSGPDTLVDAVRRALCAPFAGPGAALRGAPTVLLNVEQFRM
ncbi:ferric reductase like transmembrane component-domain-containing protein [Daedaleopsis nitida]|nr:ferric reductase like transmembrane component-domain-containing protein [Daedaleopsis nitida]